MTTEAHTPFDPQDLPEGPWMLGQPQPISLVLAGVSGAIIARAETLAQCLADITGDSVDLATDIEPPDDVLWLASLTIEGLPSPLLCWPEETATAGTGLPEHFVNRPGLIVQSLLHPVDPLTGLANLLRLLTLIDPDAGGVLDADTGRWLDHDMLTEHLIESQIEPREDLLWIVSAIEEESGHHRVVTTGLDRCGRRELALETVPDGDVDAAAELLATVAALTLETPLPPTGSTIEIGPGLHLGVSGDEDDETSPVILHAADGSGPPIEVLGRLRDDVAAIYQTERATERQRALAVNTWDRFLSIHAAVVAGGGMCYVEVPWEQADGEEARREHLWMEVESQDGSHVMAIPAHDSVLIEGMPSEATKVEVDEICSWRVVLDDQPWGPEELNLLISQLEGRS